MQQQVEKTKEEAAVILGALAGNYSAASPYPNIQNGHDSRVILTNACRSESSPVRDVIGNIVAKPTPLPPATFIDNRG